MLYMFDLLHKYDITKAYVLYNANIFGYRHAVD